MIGKVFLRIVMLICLLLAFIAGDSPLCAEQSQPRAIRVVMDNNYPPFAFQNTDGALKGILVDQWRLWEKKSGIKAELHAMDWSEALRRMQTGEFDVIDTIFKTDQRLKLYDFTPPYQKIEVPIFFRKEIAGISDAVSLRGFPVAVKAGDAAIDLLKRNGVDTLLFFNSYEAIIRAAKDHKVNVFVIDKPPAVYFLNKLGIADQFKVSIPLNVGEFHRAVRKGDSALLRVVETGFAAISPAEYQAIEKKWYGSDLGGATPLKYIAYIAIAVGVVIVLLVVWNLALHRAVANRTSELAASEGRYRTLVDSIPMGITLIDRNYRIVMVNRTQGELFMRSPDWFIGRHCYEEFERREKTCPHCPGSISMTTGGIAQVDAEGIREDGRRLSVRIRTVPLKGPDGNVVGFIEAVEDITERKQAEDSLKESEEKFRTLVESSLDVIFVLDATGVFKFASPSWEKHFGYPVTEVIGQDFRLFVHPDDAPLCAEYLSNVMSKGEGGTSPPYRVRVADGSWRLFTANGTPYVDAKGDFLYLGVGRDLSDQKRAEEERLSLERQLLHSQKLESLGVLAGGIAHDFNNIMTAIIGNADLALMRLNPESPAMENVRKIEKAAMQAAELSRQMLSYSGKGRFVVEPIDLNRLIEELLHMLDLSISKKSVLRLNLARPLPTVEADATQLRQVIMNLVINASEAIGEKSGVIAISTGSMECDRSYLQNVWFDEQIPAGLYVYIEVADTGCGMDRETLDRIFDPFFTTKFTGRGLGMATVLGIVRGHKGAIKVQSEENTGSTFTILIPACEKPVERGGEVNQSSDWKGSGSVLLVDDEEAVRDIGSEMLRELGYQVVAAADGRQAIEAFEAEPGISFVILDLTMPNLDGEQCFRELRRVNPDVKVIITSGYNEQEVSQKFAGMGLAGFIQKPYTLSMLEKVIRNISA